MPAYRYAAVDARGRTRRGVIAAASARDARGALAAKSLYPTSLSEGKAAASSGIFHRPPRIKPAELALLTRQMATMISAGVAVDQSLQAIAEQSDSRMVRDILADIRSQILEGRRLSDALRDMPSVFDNLYVAMVAAGESGGDLGGVLTRQAEQIERAHAVRSKVQAALIYPAMLSLVALGVLGLLVTVIVPKIAAQFVGYDMGLPWPTRLVVGLSDFLTHYGFGLLLVGLLAGLAAARLLRHADYRLRFDRFVLGLPWLGGFLRMAASARLARSLGTLLAGGCPMLDALKAARETQSNMFLRAAMGEIYDEVYKGGAASSAFRQAGAFSAVLAYMMGMGEQSGGLAPMLLKTAEHLEQIIARRTQSLLSLIEPLIVIIMGLVVGFIVMAIMLPIMDINKMIVG